GNEQAQATILDLARRGALAVEPDGPKKVRLRLLQPDLVRHPYEVSIWRSLAERADRNGVVAAKELPKVAQSWGPSQSVLRLERRGWFDAGAGARRRPLYVGGAFALLLSVAGFVLAIVGEEGWGMLGSGLLALAGIAALVAGFALPGTTGAGEQVAAPWRGYL